MRTSLILGRCSGKRSLFLLVVILALSAYTHTWNPAGFLTFQIDEGVYIERAARMLDHEVLYGLHDHPFLGQTVLAGFMYVTGYQGLFDDPSTDPSHLEAFYAYPRAFMGLLAVLDTLLVYLIADRMFGRRIAAVAAVIFAVAPMSLLLRLVLLDSILLPFVLSSVLLALHSRGPGDRKRHLLLLASGACLGLAIFTKVPAVTMIPPCAILAYWASRRIRDVGLWIAPVVAVPAIWPAYVAQAGQFDAWIQDVIWQAGRSNGGLPDAIMKLMGYDPILIPLGMAGFAFAAICLVLRLGRRGGEGRRTAWAVGGGGKGGGPPHDPRTGRYLVPHTVELRSLGFLIAWFSSILLLFSASGWMLFFHLSMLLPALCIAVAVLIMWGRGGLLSRDTGGKDPAGDRGALIAVTVIGLAGLLTSGVIVYLDVRASEFEAASFLLQNYSDEPNTVKVVSPMFHWLLVDVYGLQNTTGYFQDDDRWDNVATVKPRLLQNTTGFFYGDCPAHGPPCAADPAMQGAADPSYQYVPPDLEKIVLVFGNHNIRYLGGLMEGCDYTADSLSLRCARDAYTIIRLYNESNLIKEFESGVSLDAFPSLPANVEGHLINPSFIVEWTPAK